MLGFNPILVTFLSFAPLLRRPVTARPFLLRVISMECAVYECAQHACAKCGRVRHPLRVWRSPGTARSPYRRFCCSIAGKPRQARRAFPSWALGKLPPRDVGQRTNETRAFPQGRLGLLQGIRARATVPPLPADAVPAGRPTRVPLALILMSCGPHAADLAHQGKLPERPGATPVTRLPRCLSHCHTRSGGCLRNPRTKPQFGAAA